MATVKITATHILTTPLVVYAAWEPLAGHSCSMTRDGGARWGELSGRPLPAELAALPWHTPERSAAVRAWQEAQYQESYAAILAAYPHLARKRTLQYSMGEITATFRSKAAARRAGDPLPTLAEV